MALCYCLLEPTMVMSPEFAGRRQYLCPKPISDPARCGFEAFSDPLFTERSVEVITHVLAMTTVVMDELRNEEALRATTQAENEDLEKKASELERSAQAHRLSLPDFEFLMHHLVF